MKVLIAPLNWGIGHVTRSIPIILNHIQKGDTVFLASSGDAFLFLQNRFPNLNLFELPDYKIQYSNTIPVWLSVSLQSLKVFNAILKEQNLLKELQENHNFDLIISDNRYGIYHSDIPSHFICHQLNPKSPFSIFQKGVEYVHRYLCKPFDTILVPDYKNSSLSGNLSKLQLEWENKIKFIGPLSQLEINQKQTNSTHVLVLLSGKEPQRSKLERQIVNQLSNCPNSITIVGGRIDSLETTSVNANGITYFPFLNKRELESEIERASIIICRSGYSTIMDLHLLTDKRIILIPTPGQTEQEYLAESLNTKFKHFETQKQNQLNLLSLIKNVT